MLDIPRKASALPLGEVVEVGEEVAYPEAAAGRLG